MCRTLSIFNGEDPGLVHLSENNLKAIGDALEACK